VNKSHEKQQIKDVKNILKIQKWGSQYAIVTSINTNLF